MTIKDRITLTAIIIVIFILGLLLANEYAMIEDSNIVPHFCDALSQQKSEGSKRADVQALTLEYNRGYRMGQLFAYDNIVICGASPEVEGMIVAEVIRRVDGYEYQLECGE